MKVLVTGGTGTISTGIVRECVRLGFDTYAINRGNNKQKNVNGVTYIYGDVFEENIVNILSDLQFDVIVECLAYNLSQLKSSLKVFANKCSQYVFISTAVVYEDVDGRRIREEDPAEFDKWIYTADKIECENYLKEFCQNIGLKYTVIRPTVTYGDYRIPFPIATRTPAWTFFQRIIDGAPIIACESVKYSVIHIDDFSYAAVRLFENPNAFNEIFHISDNKCDILWDDVLKIGSRLLKCKVEVIHFENEQIRYIFPEIYEEIKWNKSRSMLLDDGKIKRVIPDFNAKYSLEEGLENIMTTMKKEYHDLGFVDDDWNVKCDSAILLARIYKYLSKKDISIFRKYFRTKSIKELRKIYFRSIKLFVKKMLRMI